MHDAARSATGAITEAAAQRFLRVAWEEAYASLAEGGIPIGAALFQRDGALLWRCSGLVRQFEIGGE